MKSRPFITLTLFYIAVLIVIDQCGYFSHPHKDDISKYISGQYVNIAGKVLNSPTAGQKSNKTSFLLGASSVNSQKTTGKLLVTSFSQDEINQGDKISFYTKLLSPPPAKNPGQFDYAKYLSRQGIFSTAYISSFDRMGNFPIPFYQKIANNIKRNMIETFHAYIPTDLAGVLIPMLIGEKSELTDEDKQAFKDTGLTHILVVSGLNVAYVVLIFLYFFRAFGLKKRFASLFTIPFILLFMFIVGDNPPVVRATVMALFVILSLSLAREPLIYQSLAMSAAVILILDPQALFQASFQLSFAATIGIVYLYGFLIKPFEKLKGWAWKITGATIAVSLAAQLSVLPILAYYFNRVSVIGLISNIVVVPLSGVITAFGIVLYLSHFVSPIVAAPVAWCVTLQMRLMMFLIHEFARFPYATIYVATPTILTIICYYGLLSGVFQIRRIPRQAALFCIGIPLLALLIYLMAPREHVLRITSLYSGNGTAVHIAFPSNKQWFIDVGTERDANRVILPYLRSKGVKRIDKIILTSLDKGHSGGIEALNENFPISEIVYPPFDRKNTTKHFNVDGSTITLLGYIAKRKPAFLILIDYSGKRAGFLNSEEIPENILVADRNIHLNTLFISCHRKQDDFSDCLRRLAPERIIVAGTVPESLQKSPNLSSIRRSGAITVTFD
jgi:competence protein ComEC